MKKLAAIIMAVYALTLVGWIHGKFVSTPSVLLINTGSALLINTGSKFLIHN